MSYDRSKLQLRRFEVQLHYHSAYLFWNLKGILAEKWAHGPHFNAYSHGPDQVMLTDAPGEGFLTGVYGLKVAAFNCELRDGRQRLELARDWLTDCMDVMQPKVVNKIYVRVFLSYFLSEKQSNAVATSFLDRHAGLEFFAPRATSDSRVLGGLTYQERKETKSEKLLRIGQCGIYRKDNVSGYFTSQWADDPEYAIGVHLEDNLLREGGITDAVDRAMAMLKDALASADAAVSSVVVPTIAGARV